METWDVFISHASEDKETIVEPLVQVLEENGISCWYDNNKIGWGDSLTNSINNGLKTSQYVLVVLSEAFIKKGWAKAELNAMLSMEFSNGQKKVLPLIFLKRVDWRLTLTSMVPTPSQRRRVIIRHI